MFKLGLRYKKLKTDLHLACNRLKILQAKKLELARRLKREIASSLEEGKFTTAEIRAHYLLRDEATLKALELVEMFCDRLASRYGLFKQMKEPDESLEEAISSLMWVTPYLKSDVPELKGIYKQLSIKYGSAYGYASLKNKRQTVCPDLMHRLDMVSPSETDVSKRLKRIASKYDVPYKMREKMELFLLKKHLDENFCAAPKEKSTNEKHLQNSPNKMENERIYPDVFEGYGTGTTNATTSCRNIFKGLKIKTKSRKSNNRKEAEMLKIETKPRKSESRKETEVLYVCTQTDVTGDDKIRCIDSVPNSNFSNDSKSSINVNISKGIRNIRDHCVVPDSPGKCDLTGNTNRTSPGSERKYLAGQKEVSDFNSHSVPLSGASSNILQDTMNRDICAGADSAQGIQSPKYHHDKAGNSLNKWEFANQAIESSSTENVSMIDAPPPYYSVIFDEGALRHNGATVIRDNIKDESETPHYNFPPPTCPKSNIFDEENDIF